VLGKGDESPAKISWERVVEESAIISVGLSLRYRHLAFTGRISVNRARSLSVTTRILPVLPRQRSLAPESWLNPASPPMKMTSVDEFVKHARALSSSAPSVPVTVQGDRKCVRMKGRVESCGRAIDCGSDSGSRHHQENGDAEHCRTCDKYVGIPCHK